MNSFQNAQIDRARTDVARRVRRIRAVLQRMGSSPNHTHEVCRDFIYTLLTNAAVRNNIRPARYRNPPRAKGGA